MRPPLASVSQTQESVCVCLEGGGGADSVCVKIKISRLEPCGLLHPERRNHLELRSLLLQRSTPELFVQTCCCICSFLQHLPFITSPGGARVKLLRRHHLLGNEPRCRGSAQTAQSALTLAANTLIHGRRHTVYVVIFFIEQCLSIIGLLLVGNSNNIV